MHTLAKKFDSLTTGERILLTLFAAQLLADIAWFLLH